MRGSATRIILIAASILALILMIAATHHPRTQVCPFNILMEGAMQFCLAPLVADASCPHLLRGAAIQL